MAIEEWKLLCVVRGYHACKYVWDPVLEDQLRAKHQKHNSHDKYAMAVVSVDTSASRAGRFLGLPTGRFVVFSVTDGALQNEEATYSSSHGRSNE